ncbi:zinc finger BED domain-containing protein 4-like [Rhizophagus clarus]|uniref:Zinc finger BED domain-containing protein 4-like n=1 Tax=Rhizophagus clarus TaxID=94130 RepID=A0A8H3MLI7_9GLOM|nr:zinc finger BED domain-containing protein 4-like [Rhizophagus clarus]
MTNTTLESTDRAPNNSNPFKQTAAIIKPQTKFLLDDGEKCSKNYKYDGSTGNLSLTATWINKNFEIMDVLLEISYFPTPHTAKAITEGIKNAMQKWEIENLVVSITTDNGANVVAAIRDLTPIKRLSCAAHTLQLAIMQKEIGYEEPLHLIQDISTRWNSSYLAWIG